MVGERDLIGKSVAEALPELAALGFVAVLDRVFESGEPYIGNEVRIRLNRPPQQDYADERVLDFVYQPVRDDGIRVTGIFVQVTDVTQRMAAQAALKDSEEKFRAITNSIDQMIWSTLPDGFHDFYNDRWYECTGVPAGSTDGTGWNGMFHEDDQKRAWQLLHSEEKLRQAQKMEAIGQLTGGLAHDFNNMLQGIVGALDVIKRLEASGRTAGIPRFVDMAMNSAQRAAAMTHRLLAFSRQQPLAPQRVDVTALVLSMRELMRGTVGESIAVSVDLQPRLWPTHCDPNQLESALLNLTINARDAMPGGGTLTVRAANESLPATQLGPNDALEAGEYVRISVRDSGEGRSAEVIARAFDPFFTTKALGQGTGLGLSAKSSPNRCCRRRVNCGAAAGPRCWWSRTTRSSARWWSRRSAHWSTRRIPPATVAKR